MGRTESAAAAARLQCAAEDCSRPVKAREWCNKHYLRWWKHGDPSRVDQGGVQPMPRAPSCAVEDCQEPVKYRDWCAGHYSRWYKHGDVRAHIPLGTRRYISLEEAFKAHPIVVTVDGCHAWAGNLTPEGYGTLVYEGRPWFAHRVAYELLVGSIPEGMTLDHLCRNRACVNVEHLEPVTMKENILRGTSPSAENARKTHCVRGHPFAGENLQYDYRGNRQCFECRRIRDRAAKDRRRRASVVIQ